MSGGVHLGGGAKRGGGRGGGGLNRVTGAVYGLLDFPLTSSSGGRQQSLQQRPGAGGEGEGGGGRGDGGIWASR